MTADELVRVFEATATREREIAAAFRITGRYAIASAHESRAGAFDEAAELCRGEHGRVVDWIESIR